MHHFLLRYDYVLIDLDLPIGCWMIMEIEKDIMLLGILATSFSTSTPFPEVIGRLDE